jgi:acetylornithine/N-succinyldiaminopimelate aminotransferase
MKDKLKNIPRQEEVKMDFSRLECGPTAEEVVYLTDSLIMKTHSEVLMGERDGEHKSGLSTLEAQTVVERYQKGVEASKRFANELLSGTEFNWWDLEGYRKSMQRIFERTSEGQFVNVLGTYALNRVGGSASIMFVNNSQYFPENDGVFIDALTNATVTNFGQGYPEHIMAANTFNRLTGGAQCIPYHPGPLMDVAAERLIGITPIDEEGARVAWFNSGGDAVSIGIAAAEKYTEKIKGENGRRQAVYFREAYHGNIEGRAGRTTGGINQMFHEEDRNSIELEYPNKPEEVEPVLEELKRHISEGKTSCIVFESTQGDGGGVSMDENFFVEMVKLSLDSQTPLVCDEVQSGFGRSGRIFDVEYLLDHWRNSNYVKEQGYPEKPPMIIAVAKSMTNGAAPGSAVIFSKEYAVLERAQGLNTYSAHPTTLAATLTTIDLMNQDTLRMVEHKRRIFNDAISPFLNPDGVIKKTRGNGLHLFLKMEEGYNEALQVELLGKKRVLTGTVARGALRVHAPINAPDTVWQALGKTIGETGIKLEKGNISDTARRILADGGPSGLAVR